MNRKFRANLILMILISFIGVREGIKCWSECYEKVEYIKRNGKYMTCVIEFRESFPKAKEQEKTAAKPDLVNASLYIYKKKPALNLTWIQKEQDIFSGATEGCHVTINKLNHALFYDATYKISKIKPELEAKQVHASDKKSRMIQFVYNCYGTIMQTFSLEKNYSVEFESMPTAKSNEHIYPIKISLPENENKYWYKKLLENLARTAAPTSAPIISDKETNLTDASKLNEEQKAGHKQDIRKMMSGDPKKATEVVTFLWPMMVIMCLVFLLVILTIITVLRKRKKKATVIKPTMLVITNLEKHNQDQMESMYRLVETLRLQVDIECNWENRGTICQNSLRWYTEQMTKAENIVFVAIYNSFEIENFLRTTENDDELINEFERALNYLQKNWKNVTKNCSLLVTSKSKRRHKNFYIYQFKEQYSNTDTFLKQCLKSKRRKTSQIKQASSNREDQKSSGEISLTSSDDTNITGMNSNNKECINEARQAFIISPTNTGARPKHSNKFETTVL